MESPVNLKGRSFSRHWASIASGARAFARGIAFILRLLINASPRLAAALVALIHLARFQQASLGSMAVERLHSQLHQRHIRIWHRVASEVKPSSR
jgi:hypothetical protein